LQKKLYQKTAEQIRDGMHAVLITAFRGEGGDIFANLNKSLSVRSDRCEYEFPNKLFRDGLTTVYEPVTADAGKVQYSRKKNGLPEVFHIRTGLDVGVIYKLTHEEKPIAVATLLEVCGDEEKQIGAKMYVRTDSSAEGTLGARYLDDQVISVAASMIGSGRYRYLSVAAEKIPAEYKVLIEDIG
jgi:hypothetical protein